MKTNKRKKERKKIIELVKTLERKNKREEERKKEKS